MTEFSFLREPQSELLCVDFAFGEITLYSSRSPQKTGANEDAIAAISLGDQTGICVLADGVGGQRNAAEAAEIAIQSVKEEVEKLKSQPEKLREGILNAFEKANQRIIEMGVGAGTTLAVVELHEGKMRAYHVGDSSIFLIGQRGSLHYKNTLHSPVGYALEAGVLEPSEALVHEDSHLILNVIGSSQMMIEVGPSLPIQAKDSLLICSDGLTDNWDTAAIIENFRKGSFEKTSRRLVQTCKDLMKNPIKADDLSFIFFRRKA